MVKVQKNTEKLQVLSVFLGNQAFGIPIFEIQDVLRSLELTHVPLAPRHIEGICNLRGRIVTAINLRKRIQEKNEISVDHMSVVIEWNGELYSLLVDRVGDVLTLEKTDIEEPPLNLNASWREISQGVHQLDQSIMVILDADKIIHA